VPNTSLRIRICQACYLPRIPYGPETPFQPARQDLTRPDHHFVNGCNKLLFWTRAADGRMRPRNWRMQQRMRRRWRGWRQQTSTLPPSLSPSLPLSLSPSLPLSLSLSLSLSAPPPRRRCYPTGPKLSTLCYAYAAPRQARQLPDYTLMYAHIERLAILHISNVTFICT
jgi:hypothetical protein